MFNEYIILKLYIVKNLEWVTIDVEVALAGHAVSGIGSPGVVRLQRSTLISTGHLRPLLRTINAEIKNIDAMCTYLESCRIADRLTIRPPRRTPEQDGPASIARVRKNGRGEIAYRK